MDFKSTLELHMNAMKNKDMDKFISTVNLEKVTLIMPNGALIKDKDGFVELHRDWFADNDWTLEYQILKMEECEAMAYVLAAIDYNDRDQEGKPVKMKYYLNLIFGKQAGEWLLIHDQNTIYK